jgi:hypothetical protein
VVFRRRGIDGATEHTYIALENGSYTVLISDEVCSEMLDAFLFNSTFIAENASSLWNSYPVPFLNELQISGNAVIESLQVWSADGKEIYALPTSGNFADKVTINTSGWSPGVYVVRVASAEGVEMLKVVRR